MPLFNIKAFFGAPDEIDLIVYSNLIWFNNYI